MPPWPGSLSAGTFDHQRCGNCPCLERRKPLTLPSIATGNLPGAASARHIARNAIHFTPCVALQCCALRGVLNLCCAARGASVGRLTDSGEIRQTDTCYIAAGACQTLRLGRTLGSDRRFALMCVATVRPVTTPPRKEVRMNLTISGHHRGSRPRCASTCGPNLTA